MMSDFRGGEGGGGKNDPKKSDIIYLCMIPISVVQFKICSQGGQSVKMVESVKVSSNYYMFFCKILHIFYYRKPTIPYHTIC